MVSAVAAPMLQPQEFLFAPLMSCWGGGQPTSLAGEAAARGHGSGVLYHPFDGAGGLYGSLIPPPGGGSTSQHDAWGGVGSGVGSGMGSGVGSGLGSGFSVADVVSGRCGAAGGARGAERSEAGVQATMTSAKVTGDLCVHGEAFKLGGSTEWRVFSDRRIKDSLSDFTLAGETLGRLVPRVFRYKHDPQGRLHAGIIAQELPPQLAAHVRFRVPIEHAVWRCGPASCGPLDDCAESSEEGGENDSITISSVGSAATLAGERDCPRDCPRMSDELFLVDLSAIAYLLCNTVREDHHQLQEQQLALRSLHAELRSLRESLGAVVQREARRGGAERGHTEGGHPLVTSVIKLAMCLCTFGLMGRWISADGIGAEASGRAFASLAAGALALLLYYCLRVGEMKRVAVAVSRGKSPQAKATDPSILEDCRAKAAPDASV